MADKICIITGAAKGIGKAAFMNFLANGYMCIGVDKDQAALEELQASIGGGDKNLVYLSVADLLQETELDSVILEKLGRPGIRLTLVNNVGGSREERTALEDSTWEEFTDLLTFNLKPLHTLCRICIPVMKRNGNGRIVNISSISGRLALRNVGTEYAAAKSAIIGITRHLSASLGQEGVLVNTVCPGIIGTDRMEARWSNRDAEINNKVLQSIPLNRLGTPKEVADAIYFLGSETNGYITGAILDVNGGMFAP